MRIMAILFAAEAGPQFHSFPLSRHLRSVLASHCQLNVFALRLAAQETRARSD